MSDETTATRLPFWRGWTFKGAVFELVSPLLVVAAIVWVVHLVRLGIGPMFNDANTGPTVVGTLAFAVAAFVGWMGTHDLKNTLHSCVLRGACPCCGAVRTRIFLDPSDAKSPATACGGCIAYLRASGDRMREESVEAYNMMGPPYELLAAQYLPAAKRTQRGYLRFDMPTICAVCGASDAHHKRHIDWTTSGGKSGIIGSVVGEAAADAFGVDNLTTRGHVHNNPGITGPSEPEKLERALHHLQAPVCDKHTDHGKDPFEPFGDVLRCDGESLKFASYRYYKAFCDLNHIDHGKVAASRARSPRSGA